MHSLRRYCWCAPKYEKKGETKSLNEMKGGKQRLMAPALQETDEKVQRTTADTAECSWRRITPCQII